MRASGVDMLTISAHKLGGDGCRGFAGARRACDAAIDCWWRAGSRRRGGTENLIGIAGFSAAAQAIMDSGSDWIDQLAAWHHWLEQQICTYAPDAVIFGQGAKRLANTSAIAMPGRRAETQVMQLDLAGIAVSAGAACSSGKVANSHVLEAMKAGDLAHQTIRYHQDGMVSRQILNVLLRFGCRSIKTKYNTR